MNNVQWHLDRRVSLTLIISVLGLGIAVVTQINNATSWQATIDEKMRSIETQIKALNGRPVAAANADHRITTIETEHRILFTSIRNELRSIDTRLRSIENRKRTKVR